jgi:CDP-glucose 4,6-dehydratase
MKNNNWFGKNVFITGINGFIGGNLCKKLIMEGANIFGLIRNISKDSFISYEGLTDHVVLIQGELDDKDLICRIISEEQINVIFHFAAQVEVGVGMDNPYLTNETNIRGTYTLCEAARLHSTNIEAIVIASSDKAYGSYNKDRMPYKEDYPLLPKYPYDTSKACADMIAQSYANEVYNLPIVITRFCNIYGPGQLNFSAIIPDAISSAFGYSKFIPRSDGSLIRDFIYVEDVIDLYMLIAIELKKDPARIIGQIFNAGTNSPISMRELLKMIYSLIDNMAEYERVLKLMKNNITTGEINCQYMDFEKANKFFGWSPTMNLNEGLSQTIKWFDKYLSAKNSCKSEFNNSRLLYNDKKESKNE